MRNPPEARQHPLEPIVGEEQRIAAGEQHVADDGRSRDVVDRAFPLGGAEFVVAVLEPTIRERVQYRQYTGQVPVTRNSTRSGIAVHESGDGAVGILAERIDRTLQESARTPG